MDVSTMVWEILSTMFHAGNIGGRLLAEKAKQRRCQELHEQRLRDYESWLDPALEAKTRKYISDPKNFDEVWDKLEKYKREHRAEIERKHGHERWHIWMFVDGTRPPIRSNENVITACLMDMVGKKPKYLADYERSLPLL